ncbi:hypothetical protein [Escherichia coli]|uniref:hypothetical protein n=1 Tax=Escherichia coli TaxID=562 RepID=UPI000CFD0D29|nr:hypothetical protein [Escherichia coli]
MAEQVKKRRRRGRPLKEESNAIQLEKNILDMKESFIAMVPEAHKVLRELMLDSKTKQNIRQSIAEYVLNKAEKMQEEYDDMFDEGDDVIEVEEAKPAPYLPFTTEIQTVSNS